MALIYWCLLRPRDTETSALTQRERATRFQLTAMASALQTELNALKVCLYDQYNTTGMVCLVNYNKVFFVNDSAY